MERSRMNSALSPPGSAGSLALDSTFSCLLYSSIAVLASWLSSAWRALSVCEAWPQPTATLAHSTIQAHSQALAIGLQDGLGDRGLVPEHDLTGLHRDHANEHVVLHAVRVGGALVRGVDLAGDHVAGAQLLAPAGHLAGIERALAVLLALDLFHQLLLALDADHAHGRFVDQVGLYLGDQCAQRTVDVLAGLIADGQHGDRRTPLAIPYLVDARGAHRRHVFSHHLR